MTLPYRVQKGDLRYPECSDTSLLFKNDNDNDGIDEAENLDPGEWVRSNFPDMSAVHGELSNRDICLQSMLMIDSGIYFHPYVSDLVAESTEKDEVVSHTTIREEEEQE